MIKMKKIFSVILTVAVLVVMSACDAKNEETKPGDNVSAGAVTAVMTVKDYGDITFELYPDVAPLAVNNFKKKAESGYYEGKIFHRIIEDFMIQGGSADGTGASGPSEDSYEIERDANARHYYGALCVATNALGENGDQFYIVSSKNQSTFEDEKANLQLYKDNLEMMKEDMELLESWEQNPDESQLESADLEYYIKKYRNDLSHYTAKIDMIENVKPEVEEKYAEVGGVAFLDGGYTVMGQTTAGFDVLDKIAAVPVSESSMGEMSVPDKEVVIEKVVILS